MVFYYKIMLQISQTLHAARCTPRHRRCPQIVLVSDEDYLRKAIASPLSVTGGYRNKKMAQYIM
jgi:hypothetical protein